MHFTTSCSSSPIDIQHVVAHLCRFFHCSANLRLQIYTMASIKGLRRNRRRAQDFPACVQHINAGTRESWGLGTTRLEKSGLWQIEENQSSRCRKIQSPEKVAEVKIWLLWKSVSARIIFQYNALRRTFRPIFGLNISPSCEAALEKHVWFLHRI